MKKRYEFCSKCGSVNDGSHVCYCKLCYNKYKRERYANNREAEVARAMAYNYANYDLFKERLSKYRKTDKWRATKSSWVAKNKDTIRAWDRAKRAKRSAAGGSHTKEDVKNILDRQKWKCAEPTCKKSLLSKAGYHVDHIMPIALGGTDSPENLQGLCPSCNAHKWASHPIDWARKKGRLL